MTHMIRTTDGSWKENGFLSLEAPNSGTTSGTYTTIKTVNIPANMINSTGAMVIARCYVDDAGNTARARILVDGGLWHEAAASTSDIFIQATMGVYVVGSAGDIWKAGWSQGSAGTTQARSLDTSVNLTAAVPIAFQLRRDSGAGTPLIRHVSVQVFTDVVTA